MANGPFCDCRIHIHVVYSFPSWCEHTHLGSIFVLVRSCDYRIHSVHARSLAMKIAIFLSNRCAPDGIVSTSRFSSHWDGHLEVTKEIHHFRLLFPEGCTRRLPNAVERKPGNQSSEWGWELKSLWGHTVLSLCSSEPQHNTEQIFWFPRDFRKKCIPRKISTQIKGMVCTCTTSLFSVPC
jgi:hypothetical protein